MPELSESEFCFLAKCFLEESAWELTYNDDAAKRTYHKYINCNDAKFIIIRKYGVIQGGALVVVDNFAFSESFGYILKFYVLKPFRSGKVSKHLLTKCDEWFERKKVKFIFIQPFAKIKMEASLRFFKRMKYAKEIITLYREL